MNRRWYISALIIILTIFGAVYQQQIAVPNQEIIVEFTDVDITSDETQSTIAIVKEQLQALGVDNIQVKVGAHGQLKITYYSEADIAIIKEKLSDEHQLALAGIAHQGEAPSNFPSDKSTISYNLDIYEIQKSNTNWDIDGIYVLELKPKSDRFFNPNVYASFNDTDTNECITIVAYKRYANRVIAIDNASYKIPEVRAGPHC